MKRRESCQILLANPAQAQSLSELAMRSKAHWGYDDAFMTECREELTYTADDVQTQHVFAGVAHDAIIGFYALSYPRPLTADLAALFIEPSEIGKGFGRTLLDDAKQRAKAEGARHITVQSDPNALGFYLAMGGTRIGDAPSQSIPGRLLPLVDITL